MGNFKEYSHVILLRGMPLIFSILICFSPNNLIYYSCQKTIMDLLPFEIDTEIAALVTML